MWLVLEGIDGAGKTTLAGKLKYLHPSYEVIHVGPPGEGGSIKELSHAWAAAENPNLIWDRGHLGAIVYGVDRNETISYAELRLLEALLVNHNGMTAIVNTDPRIARERRPEHTAEQLMTHYIRFQSAAHELKSHWVFMDPQQIRALFSDWQKYDKIKHMDTEGVGSNSPSIWILGEQRNPRAELQVPFSSKAGMELVWPWVNPLSMRVSNVLRPSDDLEKARQGVFSQDSSNNLYFRWSTLDRPRVLCLGQTAQAACRAAGVPVTAAVEHPQHIWRFQQAEADAWRERLALKVGMIT